MVYKVDNSTSVPVMPTPGAAGTGGWFTPGNPLASIPATRVPADWCNMVQAELLNVISAAGISPDKSKQDQLLTAMRKLGRFKLQGATTLYVTSTGNDTTGDGSVSAPFASVTGAWDYLIKNIDVNGQTVTIQVAEGTYTAGASLTGQPVGATSQLIAIQGNTANPAACSINASVGNGFTANFGAKASIRGFKVTAPQNPADFTSRGCGIAAVNGSFLLFRDMDFGTCSDAHIRCEFGSIIGMNAVAANSAPYSISGNANNHIFVGQASVVNLNGAIITLSGSRAFSVFANSYFGLILSSLNSFIGTVGSTTGQRYVSAWNGVIATNGSGANHFPGSIAGVSQTGGQYN
ncbi:DUF1565 domain-containing protein [Siccirubricoccus sp. KC 17139]|uniref:DUF1565 domain-containing protein n=1 Tax=Siccirubricoccus soli TaxID=2899147 RepID=A0ABT1CYU8_9PROT|nr:DUF1565 domain-containing protein [Siccirubricoccus soli]MCO6414826.1 DUF1565 domain-containing protein [Siccirubricoccus soli]MCP2680956.1 DUF1565 domain-containing protein [Siccirubricoccus soli]